MIIQLFKSQTYAGQRFITRTRALSPYTGHIQQVFGVIMILTAIAIYFNYDKLLQLKFLQAFPQLGQTLNGFESNSVVTQQLNALKGKLSTPQSTVDTSGLFNTNTPAPDFVGITKFQTAFTGNLLGIKKNAILLS